MWSPSIKPWRSKCPAAMVVDPLVGNPLLSFSRSISTRQCQCHCQCQATNMLSGITAQVHGLTPYKATSNKKSSSLYWLIICKCAFGMRSQNRRYSWYYSTFYICSIHPFEKVLFQLVLPTGTSQTGNLILPFFKRDFYVVVSQSKGSETGFRDGGGAVWERKVFPDSSQYLMVSLYTTAEIHELTAVRFDQDLIWFSIYFGPTKHRNQGQASRLTFLAVLCLKWYRENMWSKLDGIRA